MVRLAVPAVVAVLLVGTLAGLPATGLAAETVTVTDTPTGTERAALAPGAQLAGVVGVEGAELEAAVESRAFETRVATSRSDRARANVVADRTAALEERLADLDAEKRRLAAARENGTISEDRYRAELARLHVQSRALSRHTNETARVADRLPADLLTERGVDVESLRTLRTQARDLSGPDVAAIARGVAGPTAGDDPGPAARPGGPPAGTTTDDAGPPGTGPDRTERPAPDTDRPAPNGADVNRTGGPATDDEPGDNRTERGPQSGPGSAR